MLLHCYSSLWKLDWWNLLKNLLFNMKDKRMHQKYHFFLVKKIKPQRKRTEWTNFLKKKTQEAVYWNWFVRFKLTYSKFSVLLCSWLECIVSEQNALFFSINYFYLYFNCFFVVDLQCMVNIVSWIAVFVFHLWASIFVCLQLSPFQFVINKLSKLNRTKIKNGKVF